MVGQLHTFITCHMKWALVQLNRRLSGPKSWSVHCGKEKKPSLLLNQILAV